MKKTILTTAMLLLAFAVGCAKAGYNPPKPQDAIQAVNGDAKTSPANEGNPEAATPVDPQGADIGKSKPQTEQERSQTEKVDLKTGQSRTENTPLANDPRQGSEVVNLRLNCFSSFGSVEKSSLRGLSMKAGSTVILQRAKKSTDKYKTFVQVSCSEQVRATKKKGQKRAETTPEQNRPALLVNLKAGDSTKRMLDFSEEDEPQKSVETVILCATSIAKIPASEKRRLILIQGSEVLLTQIGDKPPLVLRCSK